MDCFCRISISKICSGCNPLTFKRKKRLIAHKGHEKKGNDYQLKELLIVKQILLVSTLGNV